MRKFGLIGYPLGHSFSKQYFTLKFARESLLNCRYDNYELESLDHIIDLIHLHHDLCGLNVTIPYKTEVIKYLDSIDNEASEIGAVNVIKVAYKEGKSFLKGFNSDVFGFEQSLKPILKNKKIENAIVLGSGGSSKAINFVLRKLHITTVCVSRSANNGMITYNDLTDKLISDNKLIINATPLGTFPAVNEKPDLKYEYLTPEHILFDLIYNPELTSFLKEGKERGCEIIGGLKMLHLQAEKAWEIWNDPNL
jgi:shikimate dehydrogenase